MQLIIGRRITAKTNSRFLTRVIIHGVQLMPAAESTFGDFRVAFSC